LRLNRIVASLVVSGKTDYTYSVVNPFSLEEE